MGQFKVEQSIEVKAPAKKIWDEILDISSWPEWKSFVISSSCRDGNLADGSKFTMKLSVKGPALPLSAKVCEFVEPKTLAWKGGASGIFQAVHSFHIEDKGEKSIVTSAEVFTGALVGLVLLLVSKQALNDLHVKWVDAIKERVEQ